MATLGKIVSYSTYFHVDALYSTDQTLQQRVAAAAAIANVQAGKDFNVVKIPSDGSTVSFLDYPTFFEAGFPPLHRSR
jgi:hypothetical protein